MKVDDLRLIDSLGRQYRLVLIGGASKSPQTARQKYGTWLKAERTKRGFTQAGLAKLTKLKQPNIAAYEKGTRVPRTSTAERIKKVFAETGSIGADPGDKP